MSLRHNDNKAYFGDIPWCSRLLAMPDQHVLIPPSRTPKTRTGEDSLFAETLQTDRAIAAALAFYPRTQSPTEPVLSLSILLAIGGGMDGWPSVLHGGIVATLMDEMMGTLLVINAKRTRSRSIATGRDAEAAADVIGAHTAQLNVRYLAPVKTPGVVLVTCKITSWEGRKIKMKATVMQKGGLLEGLETDMVECSNAEALFIVPRGPQL